MFEATLLNLLTGLVVGQIFWDTTPDGYVVGAGKLIVMQQVGGKASWYVEKDSPMPSHKHARIQINCFSESKADVSTLARLVEKTIAESGLIAEPIGAFTGTYQEQMKLHGTQQQFGFWYPDP